MWDWSSSFTVVVLFLLYALVWRLTNPPKRKKYPPGPWGFPIVGHLPLFGSFPPETFQKWREQYGDIFRIRMGSWDAIVINDYAAISDAMQRSDDVFSSRPGFCSMRMVKEVNDNQESLPFGPFGRSYLQLRKLHMSSLNRITGNDSTQELILEEVSLMIEKFASLKGKPTILNEEVQLCIGSIIHQIVFGRGLNVREDIDFQKSIESANEFVRFSGSGNPLDVMPWLNYIIPWKRLTLYRILKTSADIRYQHVLDHTETFNENHIRNDMTDIFLNTELPTEADDVVEVTKTRLLRSLYALIGAGLETTTTVMIWLITYMVAYPDVQKKVQREIDDVIGSGRAVKLDDKSKLCYTEATILEVMRRTSVTPFSVPHYTTRDTKLNGFDIDKDTVVLPNLHAINMDKIFWKDPEVFRPERLLTSFNELNIELCNRITPFGLGRRRCVGEKLAKMELFILFANIMQRCHFRKADGRPVDLTSVRGLVYKPMPLAVVVDMR